MVPAGFESNCKKYGTFLNSFHQVVKHRLEQINKKKRQKQSVCPI